MRFIRPSRVPLRSRLDIGLWLLISAVMIWNLYAYLGVDWEFLVTKHYFAGYYYGGYARELLLQDGATFAIQLESLPSLGHVQSFLTAQHETYSSIYNVDRLYSCGFLPSLIVRLAVGHVTLQTSIEIVNVILWIASIALTYGIVRAWSHNNIAALIGAAVAAGYPVYSLMFTSLKTQVAGATLLLAWIYVDTTIWPRLGWGERAALLFLTFTATMLASGGAYFILAYIVAWYVYLAIFDSSARRLASVTVLMAIVAFGLGELASHGLLQHYHLYSDLTRYHVDQTLLDSVAFVQTALKGGDTSSMQLFHFPGYSYLTSVLPWFAALCFKANPVVVAVPLIGMFLVRELRILILTAAALFAIGHGVAVVTGWTWYYAYSSAPTVQLLIIATAMCLGLLYESKLRYARIVTAVTVLAAVYFFNASPAYNMKNFYSDKDVFPVDRRLYIYHDDDMIRYW